MKLLFLDVDGVVANEASSIRHPRKHVDDIAAPECVAALNRILRETGAKIVVSASMRVDGVESLIEQFRLWGIEGEIVGITPLFEWTSPRFKEIDAYLQQNQCPDSLVILDDEDDMGALLPYLVQTKFECGLTEADADKAVALLNQAEEG